MNLQILMQRQHMRRKDLAKLLRRDNAVVTNLFKGVRPLSGEESKSLAGYFGVSTDIILDHAPLPAGNMLGAIRKDRGLSIVALADRLGLSTEILTRLETDGPLDKYTKEHLARTLECHPDDLDIPPDARSPEPTPYVSSMMREPGVAAAPELLPWPGHSFDPGLPGDYLLKLGPAFTSVPREHIGKLCFIETTDGRTGILIPHPAQRYGRYDLASPNPSTPVQRNQELRHCRFIEAIFQH